MLATGLLADAGVLTVYGSGPLLRSGTVVSNDGTCLVVLLVWTTVAVSLFLCWSLGDYRRQRLGSFLVNSQFKKVGVF